MSYAEVLAAVSILVAAFSAFNGWLILPEKVVHLQRENERQDARLGNIEAIASERAETLVRIDERTKRIEEWFGAITPIDLVNYRVNTAVADLKLQNIGSTPLVISGARIYRDDNTSVLDASLGDQPMTLDAGNLIQYIAPQVDGALNANAKLSKVVANTTLIPSLL
jgi:hypothetical protein